MPNLPKEFRALVDEFAGEITDELMAAWHRGVCDGLDMAAQMAEDLASKLPEETALVSLYLAIQQAQMHVQVDASMPDGPL